MSLVKTFKKELSALIPGHYPIKCVNIFQTKLSCCKSILLCAVNGYFLNGCGIAIIRLGVGPIESITCTYGGRLRTQLSKR
ncbi:hypothetical protein C1A40_15035 [Tamlana carrageenivorans]|uniref:Uncharacterized protein n=1 Tax=Pseudotamlana carrageenivorans TaxID=2069432 RepID=A0A2I7SLE8_9FLAO|nr:hypothetical protein C1A40_15035 [Tamlana carrageenivorans]